MDVFQSYNLQDLCQAYFAVKKPEMLTGKKVLSYSEVLDCRSVSDGLLEKGLRISITTIIQNSEDIIKAFYSSSKTFPDQQNAVSDNKFKQAGISSQTLIEFLEQILDMITPALADLTELFITVFEDYINETTNLERLKFAIFLVGLFLTLAFIWLPYLRNLSNKIFRTKGMLNMIPMEIISKNENLKNLFIQGDLLQAVK